MHINAKDFSISSGKYDPSNLVLCHFLGSKNVKTTRFCRITFVSKNLNLLAKIRSDDLNRLSLFQTGRFFEEKLSLFQKSHKYD